MHWQAVGGSSKALENSARNRPELRRLCWDNLLDQDTVPISDRCIHSPDEQEHRFDSRVGGIGPKSFGRHPLKNLIL